MLHRDFTRTDFIVVFILISAIVYVFFVGLYDSRYKALKVACVSNLKVMATILHQYVSPEMFDKDPYPDSLQLDKRNTPYASLQPILSLIRADLIDTEKMLTCPVSDMQLYKIEKISSAPPPQYNPQDISKYSHYLFTYYYYKEFTLSGIIAGDASGDSRPGMGFSPNHGDKRRGDGNGANALFGDGHVAYSKSDYFVDGFNNLSHGSMWDISSAKRNAWDSSGLMFVPQIDVNDKSKKIPFFGSQIAPYSDKPYTSDK